MPLQLHPVRVSFPEGHHRGRGRVRGQHHRRRHRHLRNLHRRVPRVASAHTSTIAVVARTARCVGVLRFHMSRLRRLTKRSKVALPTPHRVPRCVSLPTRPRAVPRRTLCKFLFTRGGKAGTSVPDLTPESANVGISFPGVLVTCARYRSSRHPWLLKDSVSPHHVTCRPCYPEETPSIKRAQHSWYLPGVRARLYLMGKVMSEVFFLMPSRPYSAVSMPRGSTTTDTDKILAA